MGLLKEGHEDIGMALQVLMQRGRAAFWRAYDEEIRLGSVPKTGGMKRAFWKRHRLLRCPSIRYQWIIVQNIGGGSLLERPKAQLPQSARKSRQILTIQRKIC